MYHHVIHVFDDKFHPSVDVQLTRPVSIESESWIKFNEVSDIKLNQNSLFVLFSESHEKIIKDMINRGYEKIELSELPVVRSNKKIILAFKKSSL